MEAGPRSGTRLANLKDRLRRFGASLRRTALRIQDFGNWGVGARLVLIVAMLALPLNALIVAVISTLAAAAGDAERASLTYTANLIAVGLEARLGRYVAISQDLARSTNLQANDFRAFDAEARQALAGTIDAWVVLADHDGRELVNTSLPPGARLPLRSEAALAAQREAERSGTIVIADVRRNRDQDWVSSVETPVAAKGLPVYGLAVVMTVPGFMKLLNAQATPDGWVTGIIDRAGNFVARVPRGDYYVGKPASVGWRQHMNQDGLFELVSLEGDQLVQSNAHAATSGWTIGIAIKKANLLAMSWGSVRWAIVLGAALTGLALLLATIIGRSITEPLRTLRTGASTIFDGSPVRLRRAPPEIVELWTALRGAFDDRQRSQGELHRVSDRLAAIIRSSTDAILSKTFDGTVTSWNESAERLFGYTSQEMIGKSIRQLIPANKQAEEDMILARLRVGERIEQYETVRMDKNHHELQVSVSISPVKDNTGRLAGASSIVRDITELKAKERALRESEQRQGEILNTVNAFIGLLDDKGRIVEVNASAIEAAGVARKAMIGLPMVEAPWWRASLEMKQRVGEILDRCLAGETVRCDLKYITGGGEIRWVDFQAAPIIKSPGHVSAIVQSGIDVTERKRAEEQVRTLMLEVNHRSKNMLGLVLSIARQSSSTNFPEFMARFSDRILALSANLELLVRNDWQGIDLEDLARAQLAHLLDEVDGRLVIEGPKLRLTAPAAQAIGMALHELGTNAVKYGALASRVGHVGLAWGVTPDQNAEFVWTEQGGPPVRTPTKLGFGHSVMTTLAERGVGGNVDLKYLPSGLVWRLRCPLANIIEQVPSQAKSDIETQLRSVAKAV